MKPQALRTLLQPLLDGELAAWPGLPPLAAAAFDALYGAATPREEPLGARPALRHDYAGVLTLWSRGGQAVMVAPARLPPAAALEAALRALGPPDAVLPHEILMPGQYAHEYLYGRRGLLLTVAEPLQGGAGRVARCRGIAPLAAPGAPPADLYLAFEDRTAWEAP